MNLQPLSAEEIRRYSRQLLLPEIGPAGQLRLRDARVLLVGAGGLGAPAAYYLAAAGVGTLGVIDHDVVEIGNLQRQILHHTGRAGINKAFSARDQLTLLNPYTRIEPIPERISTANALDLISEYDIVIDGTDNFPARYLINDACVLLNKPYVYGAALRFEGQASLFISRQGPCYRCLFPEPPPPHLTPSCGEAGVLGCVPGIIGMIQAAETLKWLIGGGQSLLGRLLLFDALAMTFREIKIRRDPHCPLCGEHPTIHELIDYEHFCGVDAFENPAADNTIEQVTVEQLQERMRRPEPFMLIDSREKAEYQLASLPGARLIEFSSFMRDSLAELAGREGDEIWVICHVGDRSRIVCRYLRERGFKNLKNVIGGLQAWSERIDPTMPQY